MNVQLVDAYWGESHRAFATGYARHSRHRVELVHLPGRDWKWRLRAAGLALGHRLRGRLDDCDALVATSMLDAAQLVAAAGAPAVPLVVYLHENQLSYPRPPGQPLERGLGLASLASVLVADRVAINSRYHRDAFAAAARDALREIPAACRPPLSVRALRRELRVVPPGLDADVFAVSRSGDRRGGPPVILWNHRWEFDKRPAAFFRALERLDERGRDFRVVLLGASSQLVPKPFLAARARFGERILRYGFAPSRRSYLAWLRRSDVVVSTAAQENFGLATAEAIAAGCFPLLPDRLAYPELLPRRLHARHLYADAADLVARLDRLLREPERIAAGAEARREAMRRFAWPEVAARMDAVVEEAVAARASAAARGSARDASSETGPRRGLR